jgi:hypothetical protein
VGTWLVAMDELPADFEGTTALWLIGFGTGLGLLLTPRMVE